MTADTVFNVLLRIYQRSHGGGTGNLSNKELEALVQAIEMLGAATGKKDWNWGS